MSCSLFKKGLDGAFSVLTESDLEAAHKLEREGFPPDEQASYDTMCSRFKSSRNLFFGYFEKSELLGFIMGTKYQGSVLTEESMHSDDPNGVCVSHLRRREGIALQLLEKYTKHVIQTELGISRLILICHSYLIPLYTRAGYALDSKSDVVHGFKPWYQLSQHINTGSS